MLEDHPHAWNLLVVPPRRVPVESPGRVERRRAVVAIRLREANAAVLRVEEDVVVLHEVGAQHL